MTPLLSDALRFVDNQLSLLDQTQLPHTEHWIACNTLPEIYDAIIQLKVRGAPLLAVAASLFIGKFALENNNREAIQQAIDYLLSSRPTAVNLRQLLQQHQQLLTQAAPYTAHLSCAIQHFNEDVELCNKIANHGLALIKDNDAILTHCNTGTLATAGIGTALGIIKQAATHRQGIHIYVDETRPLLQGSRLTAVSA